MTLKKLVVAGLAAVALMAPTAGAFAQDNSTPAAQAPADQAPAPAADAATAPAPAADATPPGNADPTKNWLKVCDNGDADKKACLMRQVVTTPGSNQFLGSFLLRDDPGEESRLLAVAAVPVGVLLPFGLTWQIDGGKPIRVPFMLCDPTSCATQLVINEAYLNSLKKGSVLKLTAKNRQNKDLVITINLAGFTSVYTNPNAMTFDEFSKKNNPSAQLEKELQDRAEQLRKELDQPAPDATTTPSQ